MTAIRNDRRQLTGVVTSTAANKTITVQVERRFRHPKYGKYVRNHTKYLVHDEAEVAKKGDTVVITATRPLSKRKRWRLAEVIESSDLVEVEGDGTSPEGGES